MSSRVEQGVAWATIIAIALCAFIVVMALVRDGVKSAQNNVNEHSVYFKQLVNFLQLTSLTGRQLTSPTHLAQLL